MKAFLIAILFVVSLSGCSERPHPSDDELLTTFNAREGEFETLAAMFREDTHMVRIAPDFLRPEGGITKERWDAYRDLFQKLGLRSGIALSGQPVDAIEFLASTNGYVVGGGSEKGYVYRENPPKQLLDSLDNLHFHDSKGFDTAYRHITGNWYLFYYEGG